MEIPPHDKDLLGRWKPEGSDTYARSFGGLVARLQALFAEVVRRADRYTRLDEREIAADLVPWSGRTYRATRPNSVLRVCGAAGRREDLGSRTRFQLRPRQSSHRSGFADPEDSSLDRQASYVIVELPGAIFRLHKAGTSGCWMAGAEPSATAAILSLGPRPTSTHMYAGYAGPIARKHQMMTLRRGQLEAVPATSQVPALDPAPFSNFASLGFSALP